ncbi:hypothetical protein CFIMG_002655RAa [Ceratocystis fimbriata CBS 114723]|uniref:Uncharacterized protein n=1 Tax=Ceratocystis fimbriata CBS 114723 TaxID=1035309 RepID=A0A2C5X476_9PEZI|nr:hypothetical protein CFIMG_002655RAa [Ceratocystis fimbriata CBS 114723]
MEPSSNGIPAAPHLVPSFSTEEDADLLAESAYELVSNMDTESQDGRLTPMLSLGTASQGGEDDVHSLADSNSDVEVDAEADADADADSHDSDHYEHETVPSQSEIDQANDVCRRVACRSTTDLVDEDEDYDTTPLPSQTLIDYVSVAADAATTAAATIAAKHETASVVTESDESEDEDDIVDGDGPDRDRTPRSSHLVVVDKDLSRRHILDLFRQCAAPETLSRSPSIDYMEDSLDKPSTPTLSMTLERPKDNASLLLLRNQGKLPHGHYSSKIAKKYGLPKMSILETLIAALLMLGFFGGFLFGTYKLATIERPEVAVAHIGNGILPMNMPTATTTIVNYHTSVRYIYVTKTATPTPTSDPFSRFQLRRFWLPNDKPSLIYTKSTKAWAKLSHVGTSLKNKMRSKEPMCSIRSPKLDHPWATIRHKAQTWKDKIFANAKLAQAKDSVFHLKHRLAPFLSKEAQMVSFRARLVSAKCKMSYLRAQIQAKAWWLHMRGHADESKLYAIRGDKYLKDQLSKLSRWTQGRV